MNKKELMNKIKGIIFSSRARSAVLIMRLGMGYITEDQYYESMEKIDCKTLKDISDLLEEEDKNKARCVKQKKGRL